MSHGCPSRGLALAIVDERKGWLFGGSVASVQDRVYPGRLDLTKLPEQDF